MDWPTLLGVAVGLAMDALAVSIAVGLSLERVTARHTFRLAFHFGLFQFLMPVAGWTAGRQVADWIAACDHWVAFALLTVVGSKMLWEGWSNHAAAYRSDPTRGAMLVTLSLATSIDALAVGLSMALLDASIWAAAVVIGLVAGVLSALGIRFAGRLKPKWGRWAELLGGCVLLAIGARILVAHLAG